MGLTPNKNLWKRFQATFHNSLNFTLKLKSLDWIVCVLDRLNSKNGSQKRYYFGLRINSFLWPEPVFFEYNFCLWLTLQFLDKPLSGRPPVVIKPPVLIKLLELIEPPVLTEPLSPIEPPSIQMNPYPHRITPNSPPGYREPSQECLDLLAQNNPQFSSRIPRTIPGMSRPPGRSPEGGE